MSIKVLIVSIIVYSSFECIYAPPAEGTDHMPVYQKCWSNVRYSFWMVDAEENVAILKKTPTFCNRFIYSQSSGLKDDVHDLKLLKSVYAAEPAKVYLPFSMGYCSLLKNEPPPPQTPIPNDSLLFPENYCRYYQNVADNFISLSEKLNVPFTDTTDKAVYDECLRVIGLKFSITDATKNLTKKNNSPESCQSTEFNESIFLNDYCRCLKNNKLKSSESDDLAYPKNFCLYQEELSLYYRSLYTTETEQFDKKNQKKSKPSRFFNKKVVPKD